MERKCHMKSHLFLVSLAFVMLTASVAFGRIWNAPCPSQCSLTPGGASVVPIDTDEAEYACCINGACRVCDACPWYLEWWC